MLHQNADLDQFNNAEVLHSIWDMFAEYARSSSARSSTEHIMLFGEGSFCSRVFERCKAQGTVPQNVQRWYYPPFKHIVLKVYHSALSMGLVLPSRLDQALDWSGSYGPFHFTSEGIDYFSGGFISIDDPGYFGEALVQLQERVPTVRDGQRELLLEAQRCLKAGCFRAAMVLIGVANEDACLALVDAIPLHLSLVQTGNQQDWNNCCNQTLAFSSRWKPAIRILESLKPKLRKIGKGEPWLQWWEMVPGSLYTVGEAVRIARNNAAHSVDRPFSKAEIALLLSSMPTQLEMIASITAFLMDPAIDLTAIQTGG